MSVGVWLTRFLTTRPVDTEHYYELLKLYKGLLVSIVVKI